MTSQGPRLSAHWILVRMDDSVFVTRSADNDGRWIGWICGEGVLQPDATDFKGGSRRYADSIQ